MVEGATGCSNGKLKGHHDCCPASRVGRPETPIWWLRLRHMVLCSQVLVLPQHSVSNQHQLHIPRLRDRSAMCTTGASPKPADWTAEERSSLLCHMSCISIFSHAGCSTQLPWAIDSPLPHSREQACGCTNRRQVVSLLASFLMLSILLYRKDEVVVSVGQKTSIFLLHFRTYVAHISS
jgi:hypothetical protein